MKAEVTNVVRFLPNYAYAPTKEEMAARLRETADLIEQGNFPKISRICVVIDESDEIKTKMFGQSTTKSMIVGLLEWAKFDIINGN